MSWAKLVSLGDSERRLVLRKRSKECHFLIGRNPDCTLVLEDMHVSARHLSVITRTDKGGDIAVFVKDSSTNGTWLNGERLEKGVEVQMKTGDEVRLACEDDAWDLHTFKYVSQTDTFSTLGRNSITNDAEVDDADENKAANDQSEKELMELQDKVSTEASRLAACVFNNNEMFSKLLTVAKAQPSTDNIGNETEVALLTANQSLRYLLNEMMGTLRSVKKVINAVQGSAIPVEDTQAIMTKLDAILSIERWEETMASLETSPVATSDVETVQQHEVDPGITPGTQSSQ